MSTITTINSGDQISASRAVINTNFSNLNTDKVETSVMDTDTALAANSDAKIPSQKAVKTYVDTQGGANASETVRGVVEEATDAEVAAGTATGGTGAKLFVSAAKLATALASYQKSSANTGTASRDITTASGNQVIAHGLDHVPTCVRMKSVFVSGASVSTFSDGTWFTGGKYSSYTVYMTEGSTVASADNVEVSTSYILALYLSGSAAHTGTITVDATNITIAWTKIGSPGSNVYNFVWEAS